MRFSKIKKFGLVITFAVVFWCNGLTTNASANTLFDVPSIGLELPNKIYENTTNLILATSWGHGTEGYIINTVGIDAGVTELNNNVSPKGNSIVSVYTNGAEIPASAMAALADAGWSRFSWYYYDFMVEGDAAALESTTPECKFTQDDTVDRLLAQVGFDGQYETISISGWYAKNASVTLYTKDTIFHPNSNFDIYKYQPGEECFIKLAEQGYYGANYFSLYQVLGDGIYFATDKALTEEQMTFAAAETPEVPDTPAPDDSNKSDSADDSDSSDNAQSGADGEGSGGNGETDGEKTDAAGSENADVPGSDPLEENPSSEVIVSSADQTVFWFFAGNADLSGFTAEATIEVAGENEVAVSFAYDGELPAKAEVMITLPDSIFSDGTMLHLYYCNPDGSRELVDSKACHDGAVTFSMSHCSDYIITSVLEADTADSNSTLPLVLCGVGAVVIAGIVAGVVLVKRKKSAAA